MFNIVQEFGTAVYRIAEMFAISVVKGVEQLEMIKLSVQYFSAIAFHLLGDTEMPHWHRKWRSEVPVLVTLAHKMQQHYSPQTNCRV